jgi:hypothetical protein
MTTHLKRRRNKGRTTIYLKSKRNRGTMTTYLKRGGTRKDDNLPEEEEEQG